jgi:hypothetical protein
MDVFARSVSDARTNDADVKSSGPDLPVLRSSWRQRSRFAPMTGARQPVPGGITYKR